MSEEIGIELINSGIESLKNNDPNTAADIFEQVLKQRVEKYGELGLPCAECYYLYGKSLLEVARMETDQLLFTIKETPQNSAETSFSDSVSAILKTATVQIDNKKTLDKNKEESSNNKNKEDNNTNDTNNINDNNTENNDKNDKNQQYDDAETFQIAWEWLDTARVILSRELDNCKDDGEKDKLSFQYADILSLLGQLGLETDNIEPALDDLLLCLKLRKPILPKIDRTLAETHFYVGMAFQLNEKLDEALSEFDKAKTILTTILEDSSISSGLQHIIKTTLQELNTKIAETQQLVTGIDESSNEQVQKELSDILNNKPKPINNPQPTTEIRNLGVFGCGKKRKRDTNPTDNTNNTNEEPPKKQMKISHEMSVNE